MLKRANNFLDRKMTTKDDDQHIYIYVININISEVLYQKKEY